MERMQERILIVDDDPLNVRVLVELLRSEYQLVIARDGPQTLDRLAQASLPNLILLDVMMPGMDGFEVCRRIKAHPDWRAIPVIFVTALNQPFDESAAFEAGGVDFITKPVSPAVLHSRLRTHLRLRRTERLLLRQNIALDELASDRGAALQASELLLVQVLGRLCRTHGLVTPEQTERRQRWAVLIGQRYLERPGFPVLSARGLAALVALVPLQSLGRLALGPTGYGEAAPRLTVAQAQAVAQLLAGDLRAPGHGSAPVPLQILDALAGQAEHWDGSGGPAALAGTDIPLAARLLALAVWLEAFWPAAPADPVALRRDVTRWLEEAAAGWFDPDLVAAVLDVPDWTAALAAVALPC